MRSEASDSIRVLLPKKVTVPALPDDVIFRTHLATRLREFSDYPVTIIQAPAGYGKSCLVASWAKRNVENCAWVGLDEEDSRLERFWLYVFMALLETDLPIDDLGDNAFGIINEENIFMVIDYLCSMIEKAGQKIVLIIEDYHFVGKGSPVHDTISYLIAHLPENMHLIITSRTYPEVGLSKLRVQGRLREIGEMDLKFKHEEVAGLFSRNKLALGDDEVKDIAEYTRGWPVAIKLVALAYDTSSEFLMPESLMKARQLVGSYLFEEVIGGLPEEVKTFLEVTCCVDGFSLSLARHLLGDAVCDPVCCIDYLCANSLFITNTPKEDGELWYAYHALFVEALRQRFPDQDTSQHVITYRRALEWYESNGLIEDAVKMAEQIEDYDAIKRAISRLQKGSGGADTFVMGMRWYNILPEEYILNDPQLCALEIMCLTMTGNIEAALARINHLESCRIKEDDEFYGLMMAAKALPYSLLGKDDIVIECTNEALKHLPEEDDYLKGLSAQMLAGALSFTRPEEGVAYFEQLAQAIADGKVKENENQRCSTHACLSLLYAIMGKYDEACKWADVAFEPYGNEAYHPLNPMLTYAYAAKAISAYRQADYSSAQTSADYALLHFHDCWNPMSYAQVCATKAMMAYQDGNYASSYKYVQDAIEVSPFGFARSHPALPALRNWSAEGLISKEQFVAPVNVEQVDSIIWIHGALDFIEGNTASLEHLIDYCHSIPRDRVLINISFGLLIALMLEHDGRIDEADTVFSDAVARAQAAGAKQILIENAPDISKLLKRLTIVEKGGYAKRLLNEITHAQTQELKSSKPAGPLTRREEEVFGLVAEGYATKEIAMQLTVSPETVKKHIANVYARFGVHSRVQAITRLRELGVV